MPLLAQGSDDLLLELWRARIEVHERDSYAGVRMSELPEDLRTYEKILWERAPQGTPAALHANLDG